MTNRKVERLIEPILDDMDYELVDIETLSERGRWILRIYVDKEGGMTLDDCARVSREIGDLIDVKDIFQHKYVLEVSSPGLNRPLKRERDFLWALGKKVKVKMVNPVKGRRNFVGYLRDLREGTLHLEVDKTLVFLSRKDVKKANLVFEFENGVNK
ncbi:MAG: ribosome maturation factor RimP [Deltaproteobacteria bacterium]|nr:ribosome maturation factor RimP [Deltaproteobacteria bacterium]